MRLLLVSIGQTGLASTYRKLIQYQISHIEYVAMNFRPRKICNNKCRFLLSEIMSLKEDGLQKKEQKSNREDSPFFFQYNTLNIYKRERLKKRDKKKKVSKEAAKKRCSFSLCFRRRWWCWCWLCFSSRREQQRRHKGRERGGGRRRLFPTTTTTLRESALL